MDPVATPAAPAQPIESAPIPETAPTISATRDAANKGDFSSFDDAHTAAKRGAPLARVDPPADAAAPAAAATPAISKRQQDTNDRIRAATEKAVADAVATRDAEIARLRAQPTPRPDPAAPAPPAAEPDWKRYAALPEAPKIAQFESIEEHAAAMAVFVNTQIQADAHSRASADAITAAQQDRVSTFVSKLTEARTADPEFVAKLTPQVKDDLKPFAALKPGEGSGPINVIGEQVYDSPVAPQMLLHFSQHPEVLQRLTTVPEHIQRLPQALRVKAHIAWMVKEFGKVESQVEASIPAAAAAVAEPVARPSTITAAPPPVPTVTRASSASDPKAAALARGDFKTFNELDVSERLAKRARA